MGHRGYSFLEIYILGIFGGISSNLTLDRCQKHLKKYLTPMGARGAKRGTVFLNLNSWYCPQNNLNPRGAHDNHHKQSFNI